MVNLNYSSSLNVFFKGISGLNFKLYDVGNYLTFIPFVESFEVKADRFLNAGFESQSFLINSADITLFYLITMISMGIYFLISIPFRRFKIPKKFFDKQIAGFKYGAFIQLWEASFLVTYMCSFMNLQVANGANAYEISQSVIAGSVFIVWSASPVCVAYLMVKNITKIKDLDAHPEFNSKWGNLWQDLKTENLICLHY
jgi:hypothetical protein